MEQPERSKLNRAQAEMRLIIGIALGIQFTVEGELDIKKSYYANAIDLLEDCDEDLIKSMMRTLQDYLNERFE